MVRSTVCKIRGPMTNQAEKMGKDEFQKIDWVLTDLKYESAYMPDPFRDTNDDVHHVTPILEVNIETQDSKGKLTHKINDLSKLRPRLFETQGESVAPLDWENESISDHVPLCVRMTLTEPGFRHFQMNLLGNGLAGDGFLYVPDDFTEAGRLRSAIDELIEKTIKTIHALAEANNVTGDLKQKRIPWEKGDYKDVTAADGYKTWAAYRDAFLEEKSLQKVVKDSSATGVDDKIIFNRLPRLSRSIMSLENVGALPDVVTFQENDMAVMLSSADMLNPFGETDLTGNTFADRYTCVVNSQSPEADEQQIKQLMMTAENGYEACSNQLEQKEQRIAALRTVVEDTELHKKVRDALQHHLKDKSLAYGDWGMAACTLENEDKTALLLKRVGNGVKLIRKFKENKKTSENVGAVQPERLAGFAVPDGVAVYVDRTKYDIVKVQKTWLAGDQYVGEYASDPSPMVTAWIHAKGDHLNWCHELRETRLTKMMVVSAHLASGTAIDERKAELRSMAAHVRKLKEQYAAYSISIGMDANSELTDATYESERNALLHAVGGGVAY